MLARTKTYNLQDHKVTYLNPRDLAIFTPEVKQKILQLDAVGVTDIAIDRNMLYLKQDLIDLQQSSVLGEFLGKRKLYDEQQKKLIMEQMIDLLSDQDFLALFTKQKNAE